MVLEHQSSFLKNVIHKKYLKQYSVVLFSTVQFMWDTGIGH